MRAYIKLAARDNIDEIYTLGEVYEQGKICPINIIKSFEYYQRAFTFGHSDSLCKMEMKN
jgi:TPR repeat protein